MCVSGNHLICGAACLQASRSNFTPPVFKFYMENRTQYVDSFSVSISCEETCSTCENLKFFFSVCCSFFGPNLCGLFWVNLARVQELAQSGSGYLGGAGWYCSSVFFAFTFLLDEKLKTQACQCKHFQPASFGANENSPRPAASRPRRPDFTWKHEQIHRTSRLKLWSKRGTRRWQDLSFLSIDTHWLYSDMQLKTEHPEPWSFKINS